MAYSDDRAGLGSGGVALQSSVPRLVLGIGAYAVWRPVMENTLLRAGVITRDYKEKNPDWAALEAAVDQWAKAEEEASIALALGRVTTSATGSKSTAGLSAAEKEARRGAIEAVARTRKAYALLYQALSDELRRLSAAVPQGDAYGLWNWLEKRFQSTEQDNIGDLWDEFTKMSQDEDESFDAYKARVDRVYGLLAHAKDKPSAGLYAHRLLWKLSPRYNPAVLALKASGKLKVAATIDWEEIVAFVNNHERSEQRLHGDLDAAGESRAMMTAAAAMARGNRRGRNGAPAAGIVCYNCGGTGHISRHCSHPRRRAPRPRREGMGDRHEGEAGSEPEEPTDNKEAATSNSGRNTERGGLSYYGRRRQATGNATFNRASAAVLALTSDEEGSIEDFSVAARY